MFIIYPCCFWKVKNFLVLGAQNPNFQHNFGHIALTAIIALKRPCVKHSTTFIFID